MSSWWPGKQREVHSNFSFQRTAIENWTIAHGAPVIFLSFAFADVVHYLLFDTFVGDCFLNLSSVMSQNTGVPIEGSCSAQLASLRLIFREKTQPLRGRLLNGDWVCFRDNSLFLQAVPLDPQACDAILEQIRVDLKGLTGMDIHPPSQEPPTVTARFPELCH